ncbi:MAG: phasin family protein [Pseudolabrys sp.]|jgi:hypothetical protein
MNKDTTEFTQQSSERAMQAANLGMDWARELAERSLNQSKVVLDGFFTATRKMAEEFENQTSAIREHSTSLTEKTLSNTFDFGHKLARLREPHEFVELQSEFISRQSQAIADQTKELGQIIRKGTEQLAKTTAGATAKPSRAA